MYRDKNTAGEQRIEALEDKLAAQAAKVQALEVAIAKRDAHTDSLIATFAGRSHGAYRRWKALAIGALVATVGVVVVSEMRVRAAEVRADAASLPDLAEVPLLADPADVPAAPPPDEPSASGTHPAASGSEPRLLREDPWAECSPGDPLCGRREDRPRADFDGRALKESLLQRMREGTATEGELRMLKAICMNDGDLACRDRVAAALRNGAGSAP